MNRHGFTIVEMLVTVGLIVFLAGLTLTMSARMAEQSEIRQTELTLELLDQAVDAWERAAERKLTWGDGAEYDVRSDTAFVFVISEVLDRVRHAPLAKEILARIDTDFVHLYRPGEMAPWIKSYQEDELRDRFFGTLTVLDAWGTPIYSTHPGAPVPDGTPLRNEDGTEQTLNELFYGVARHRRICFVSAGPDGLFGLETEFHGLSADERVEAVAKARRDNVYSYMPDEPLLPSSP